MALVLAPDRRSNTSGSPRPGRRGAGRGGAHAVADALEKVRQHGGVAVVEGFEEDPADELTWPGITRPTSLRPAAVIATVVLRSSSTDGSRAIRPASPAGRLGR